MWRSQSACFALVLVTGCDASEPPFDFDAACRMAAAPATTPTDLRKIFDTINDASNDNYQPTGEDAVAWRAAVLLGEAARKAAAPYAVPSEFAANLPSRPDTSEVRTLQAELKVGCNER